MNLSELIICRSIVNIRFCEMYRKSKVFQNLDAFNVEISFTSTKMRIELKRKYFTEEYRKFKANKIYILLRTYLIQEFGLENTKDIKIKIYE